MSEISPLRGEVWVCAFPGHIGPHPAVVLTANRIAQPLSGLTVVIVTGTAGPSHTHVRVGSEAGLKKYDESYVNCSEVHTMRKHQVRRRLGVLAPVELRRVEGVLRTVLDLN